MSNLSWTCSSVPQSCYGRDKCFALGHIGCYTYSWQVTFRPNFRSAQIFPELRRPRNVLYAVSLSRLVGFIIHGVLILTLRTFGIYNCSQIPDPFCPLQLTFRMPHGAEILFSDMGECFTVGLLVTNDTVPYSDCSLDATWT